MRKIIVSILFIVGSSATGIIGQQNMTAKTQPAENERAKKVNEVARDYQLKDKLLDFERKSTGGVSFTWRNPLGLLAMRRFILVRC